MGTGEEILRVLARIEAKLDALAGAKPAATPAKATNTTEGEIASDEDLDSKYGDPTVRRDPPRWTGPSYVDCRYSQCPSDYLETLAGFLTWKAGQQAQKDERDAKGRPRTDWTMKDAARARGWAKRNAAPARTAGKHTTAKAADYRSRPAPAVRPGENPDAEPEI